MRNTIRVPAISSKMADIPPDEYSWRKYGQKPIKGSPYPRYHHHLTAISSGSATPLADSHPPSSFQRLLQVQHPAGLPREEAR